METTPESNFGKMVNRVPEVTLVFWILKILAIALVAVFVIWYLSERTLSVHTIYTVGRELFYWAAILFTFSLGASAGDLLSERLGLGYPLSAVMFAAAIALIYLAYRVKLMNEVLAFWLAYILTRPLGASMGDLLTQEKDAGGLGLGTIPVSVVCLLGIVGGGVLPIPPGEETASGHQRAMTHRDAFALR